MAILFNSSHRLAQSLSILCAYDNKGHGNNNLFVKKEGKDTWQSILGYLAKYPNKLFYGSYMLEKLNQDFYACGVGFTRKMNINPQLV